MYSLLAKLTLIGLAAAYGTPSLARRSSPATGAAFSVMAAGGFTTVKSETMQNNDTTSAMLYGFKVSGGEENRLAMEFQKESASVDFALSGAHLDTTWQEMTLSYRWLWFSLGVVISNATYVGNEDGGDVGSYVNAFGSGFGAALGVVIPAGKDGAVVADVRSVSITEAKELNQKDLVFGSRLDVDMRGLLGLFDYLDLAFGFKYRTYSVTLDGTAGAELHASTYLGVVTSVDF